MGTLVVLEASFVTVEGTVASLAVVVNVNVRFTVAARDYYTRFLLFGQV